MRADQETAARADRFADAGGVPVGEIQRFHRQLPGIESRVGPRRVEFQRGKPLGDILQRPFRRGVGVVVNLLVRDGVGRGIQIGIAAQPFMYLSAEQFIDRLVQRLADDIPERHFDAAEDTHHHGIGTLREAGRIDKAEVPFDLARFGARKMPREHVVDHRGQRLGVKRHPVDFSIADDAAGSRDLDENPVRPTPVDGCVPDHEGLDVLDLHALVRFLVPEWVMSGDILKDSGDILKDHVRSFLSDHDACGIGIGGHQRRHDRGIGHPQTGEAMQPEPGIEHGAFVHPHAAGGTGVEDRRAVGTQVIQQRVIAGHFGAGKHLFEDIVGQGRLRRHLADQFHAHDHGFAVGGRVRIVRPDRRFRPMIGRCDPHMATAFKAQLTHGVGKAGPWVKPRPRCWALKRRK